LVAMLGPSGSGKSLTLRLIAGILRPDAGRIILNGRTLFDSTRGINLAPGRRQIGFVFQDYALFPHLTVAQNIAYGINRWPLGERRRKVTELLKLMRLEGLEREFPTRLSGGQQQRVALARALAPEPELLLLDEPFSALDNRVRERLVREFSHLNEVIGITTLLVTHNLEEAYALSSKIAVVEGGRLLQFGTRDEILRRPQRRAVARFTGTRNIFDGLVIEQGPSYSLVRGERFEVITPHPSLAVGERVVFSIRPEDVLLVPPENVADQEADWAGHTEGGGCQPEGGRESGESSGSRLISGERQNAFLATLLEERPRSDGYTLYVSLCGPKIPADYDLELTVSKHLYRAFGLGRRKTFYLQLPPEDISVWRE
ncbi:MAG: ATP-binding cassette domain-containing protein, partial [Firmicutes bacterium]|nr:ATP-binding cassette domain-containing protein [Bacillota bacterium]